MFCNGDNQFVLKTVEVLYFAVDVKYKGIEYFCKSIIDKYSLKKHTGQSLTFDRIIALRHL
jgi:hypothetical protein